jgi:RNA polymerase sigma-70 factor (ECF subfamily)
MIVQEMSNEELIVRIAGGDDAALGDLYDRLGGLALGLARRVVRDPALAEDVVQEAFLSVWRSAPRFDVQRGSVETWVLTLTHRRAIDAVRREQRRRTGEPFEREATVPAAEHEAEQRERRRLVQRMLAALPAEHRELLELAYYGGLTQSEIAARLSIPLGTIKSRTSAALTAARALLTPAGTAAPVARSRRAATVGPVLAGAAGRDWGST